jgi:hypothetical protein
MLRHGAIYNSYGVYVIMLYFLQLGNGNFQYLEKICSEIYDILPIFIIYIAYGMPFHYKNIHIIDQYKMFRIISKHKKQHKEVVMNKLITNQLEESHQIIHWKVYQQRILY